MNEYVPGLKFEIRPDGTVTFTGYTPAEIVDVLVTYREHMRLMMSLAQESSTDAVRYRPSEDFPFTGLDDARPQNS